MDQEIKERWITKLTSGDYAQTTGQLSTENGGYCCLGVLCEIAVEDGIVFKSDGHYISKLDTSDEEYSVLPRAVVQWAGLTNTNPDVDFVDAHGVEESDNLAELNDNGMTFSEIAELIKNNF